MGLGAKERWQVMSFVKWLGLMFIYLKLTNQIGWSWGWALTPIWVDIGLVMAAEIGKAIDKEKK